MRAATAAAHARVDALYSKLDLAGRDDYGRFLLSHAAAFIPLENALVAAGADALLPGWSTRRRGDALRTDLAALDLAVPPLQASPRFVDEASLWGGLYVLEGSRLGGAMLVRSVAAGLPTAFLHPDPASPWRAFTVLLDQNLTTDAQLRRAAMAAKAVFAVFESCARATLEPTPSAD